MSRLKRLTAALLLCGGIATIYIMLPAKGLHNRKLSVELRPIRSDPFADHLHRQITSVARLMTSHPRPVIFDNDAATDDALALILIGNDPGIALQAVTVSGTGETHARSGAANMAAILRSLGKADIPVAYGRETPLSTDGQPFPESVRHAMDHLLDGTTIAQNDEPFLKNNAVELMHRVVANSKEKVTILVTGPLTNLAEFLLTFPDLKKKIEKVIIMGGAVNVPGNIHALLPGTKNVASEWNFYADPEAVQHVFASGVPITLVALDATNQVPMTKKFYETIASESQPDLQLAHALVSEQAKETDYYMWDALAAMVLLDSSIASTTVMPLIVNHQNGSLKVAAKHQKNAANIDVVTNIHHPDAVLMNFVAMVKSNHLFAQRKFYHDVSHMIVRNYK